MKHGGQAWLGQSIEFLSQNMYAILCTIVILYKLLCLCFWRMARKCLAARWRLCNVSVIYRKKSVFNVSVLLLGGKSGRVAGMKCAIAVNVAVAKPSRPTHLRSTH